MAQFRITYDGKALEHHEMDVRELSPALLAMADLLDASVRALHGDRATAQINVKGSFKTGSFNIDFNTAVNFVRAVKDIFAGDGATAIANAAAILGVLGLTGKGLAQVLKWLRGRRIVRVEPLPDEKARIHVEQEYMDVEVNVVLLLRDLAVREAFDRVLAPLDREGVEVFASGNDANFDLIVKKEERGYFAPPAGEDVLLLEETRKMVFSIVSLSFKEDNKWRLTDGNAVISAKISDEKFIADMNSNDASFSKGDVLVCSVLVRQWQTDSGARTEYEVVEVLEHRKAARQIPIPGL